VKPDPYFFETEHQARLALVNACQYLSETGLSPGKSGNVSVRWHRSEQPGLLITPSSVAADRLEPDDMVWMPLDEHAREAWWATQKGCLPPSSEWAMHMVLYQHRQASAVVHTHSAQASSLSCLPQVQAQGLAAFHYMVAAAGGHIIPCARYATFGSQQLAHNALQALLHHQACLLAHHGVLAFGQKPNGEGLGQALLLAQEVEALAAIVLPLLILGTAQALPESEMARVVKKFQQHGYGSSPSKDSI
jgi:L-fuculose-phosphate aldolase